MSMAGAKQSNSRTTLLIALQLRVRVRYGNNNSRYDCDGCCPSSPYCPSSIHMRRPQLGRPTLRDCDYTMTHIRVDNCADGLLPNAHTNENDRSTWKLLIQCAIIIVAVVIVDIFQYPSTFRRCVALRFVSFRFISYPAYDPRIEIEFHYLIESISRISPTEIGLLCMATAMAASQSASNRCGCMCLCVGLYRRANVRERAFKLLNRVASNIM